MVRALVIEKSIYRVSCMILVISQQEFGSWSFKRQRACPQLHTLIAHNQLDKERPGACTSINSLAKGKNRTE